jgi:Fe-S-cluster containining protein
MRKCKIYEQRPRFCRVLPETFADMFGIKPEEFNDFAIDCCCQQISAVYGDESQEMQRYESEVVNST